jgi:hypothetical protein
MLMYYWRLRTVSKLSAMKEAQQASFLDPDDLMRVIEAEEQGGDGLCPVRAWCFPRRLRVSKHAMAWHHCGFEERRQLYQCPAYSNDGHECPLDRGDVTARCAGAEFCGEEKCHHANPHRWDAMRGCHAVRCRKLAAALDGWDKETKGPPPDIDAAVACEQV